MERQRHFKPTFVAKVTQIKKAEIKLKWKNLEKCNFSQFLNKKIRLHFLAMTLRFIYFSAILPEKERSTERMPWCLVRAPCLMCFFPGDLALGKVNVKVINFIWSYTLWWSQDHYPKSFIIPEQSKLRRWNLGTYFPSWQSRASTDGRAVGRSDE